MPERPTITQEMVHLYDDYTHLTLDRRGFMAKLTKLAGSSAAAAAIVPMLAANGARAAVVPEDEPRLKMEDISFPAQDAQVSGYLAMPVDAVEPLPGIIVIHENRGLNPHIRDVARRAALEGFVALAPDFLAIAGGTPDDEDKAREMITDLDPGAILKVGLSAIAYLKAHEATSGRIGAVGFCWGGGVVNQLAPASADLEAAVVFYGRAAEAADVPKIKARMMMHYAALDERINYGIQAFKAALDEAGIDYTSHMYDGVNHAFHNDTSEARYDPAAAELAWTRTVKFFRETLS